MVCLVCHQEAEAGNARLRDAMKELKGALQDEQTKLAHVQAESQALQQVGAHPPSVQRLVFIRP